jgi:hypothetical protein
MKRISLFGILALLTLVCNVVVLTPQTASAQASTVCDGLSGITSGEEVVESGECPETPGGGSTIKGIIEKGLNALTVIAGLVAVVMIIVSGVKFLTSGGDSNAVASARKTLLFAIAGIIIVAMSQFIVRFVINAASQPPAAVESRPDAINGPR